MHQCSAEMTMPRCIRKINYWMEKNNTHSVHVILYCLLYGQINRKLAGTLKSCPNVCLYCKKKWMFRGAVITWSCMVFSARRSGSCELNEEQLILIIQCDRAWCSRWATYWPILSSIIPFSLTREYSLCDGVMHFIVFSLTQCDCVMLLLCHIWTQNWPLLTTQ